MIKQLFLFFSIFIILPNRIFAQDLSTIDVKEIKSRTSKEIQDIANKQIKNNSKLFWSNIAVINQIEASIILTSDSKKGSTVSPWNVTILDFKLGKTSALYFYGQLRFGTILGGVVNSSIGNTTKFNYGGLIGMGGKFAEMYVKRDKQDYMIISSYISGGLLLESKRYEQAADLPYFAFEINNYLVFESPLASGVLGYSMGGEVINTYFYLKNYSGIKQSNSPMILLRVGLQFGIMF